MCKLCFHELCQNSGQHVFHTPLQRIIPFSNRSHYKSLSKSLLFVFCSLSAHFFLNGKGPLLDSVLTEQILCVYSSVIIVYRLLFSPQKRLFSNNMSSSVLLLLLYHSSLPVTLFFYYY